MTVKDAMKEALSDDNKNISVIRIMSAVALLVAAYLTVCAAIKPYKLSLLYLELVAMWLVAAFAPKVIQKVVEKWADWKTGTGGDNNGGIGSKNDGVEQSEG